MQFFADNYITEHCVDSVILTNIHHGLWYTLLMKRNLQKDKLNDFLDEIMNLNDLPGLAVGVSVGGADITGGANLGDGCDEFVGVRGYRDYAARIPLSEDDIFHCASVSKLFTSSAIMKLVEAGVLDLNARLRDVLPDLNIADRRYEDIRLWNMLTHTSGLGDVSDYHWYDFETDDDSLRRYVYESEEVLLQPMLWKPQGQPRTGGSLVRYSNIAYEILGQIVSEYSGRMPKDVDRGGSVSGDRLSYEDFVTEHLLRPAGMLSSTMKTFDRPGAPDFKGNECMAQPHEKKADRSIGPVQYYPYTRQHAPSSTLTSNVRDLLRWGRAHLASSRGKNGPLLKSETYQTVWREYATVPNNGEKMGLGWFMREQTVSDSDATNKRPQVFRLCGHEGTDDGFRASFWLCPDLDTVTVVLSNLSGAPVKRINKKLFETIIRTCAL